MALAKLGDGTAFQELNAGIRARSGSDQAASFQHLEYVGGKNSLLLLRELLEDKTPEPPTHGDEVFIPLRTLACFTLSDIASDSPTSRIQCSILTPEKLAAAWKAWFAKHPEALK